MRICKFLKTFPEGTTGCFKSHVGGGAVAASQKTTARQATGAGTNWSVGFGQSKPAVYHVSGDEHSLVIDKKFEGQGFDPDSTRNIISVCCLA